MDHSQLLLPDEDLVDLYWNNYKLLQKKQGFRFSAPSVLLAYFTQSYPDSHILELGCGSGGISVLLKARYPQLSITAVELQEGQAEIAKRNFAMNAIDATVLCEDFRTLDTSHHNRYPVIVTNPPYYPISHGRQSPSDSKSIARHERFCTLEDVFCCAQTYLKPDGHLFMVHIPQRLDEMFALSRKHGLSIRRLQFIHHNAEQPAGFVLLDAVKTPKNLTYAILPPVFLYEGSEYSPQMKQIQRGAFL